MTENEAKNCVQGKLDCMNRCDVFDCKGIDECDNCEYCYSQGNFGEQKKAFEMAIQALEENQQYHAIGTVEQCQKSVDICKAMIERNITPETIEEYIKFEDECVKKGFTIKSLLESREKAEPKKPNYEGDGYYNGELVLDTWICPNCGKSYEVDYDNYDYCPNCGQNIDHSGLTEDD